MSMREFIGETNFDFVGWRLPSIIVSLVVISIGLFAVAKRGQDLFDIDFTGGSSVTIVFEDDQPTPYAEVYETLQTTPLGEENLSLVEMGDDDTRYTVTTINDDVIEVENILKDAFGDKLKKYQVNVEEVKEFAPGEQTSLLPAVKPLDLVRGLSFASPLSYVTLLQPAATEEATPPAENESVTAAPEGEAAEDAKPTEEAAPATETPAAEPAAETPATTETPAPGAETPATTTPATPAEPATANAEANPFVGGATAKLKFAADKDGDASGVSHDTLDQMISDALKKAGKGEVVYEITNEDYREGSNRAMEEWQVSMALPPAEAKAILEQIAAETNAKPIFPLSSKIGGRVAGQMATSAAAAMILCLVGIIAYVWFRFHGVIYGIAAVIALIHDVLVTLGFVALSAYLVNGAEGVASLFLIDKFQINLVLVAAFLTIIGYSLNDTIVIFDRIREVKGKSPRLTKEIINLSVNQTLARTILTSFTTLTSVIVLYIFGGDGIHAFAFALLVGFIAGCYSTIFIANPVLLWLAERFESGPAPSTTVKS